MSTYIPKIVISSFSTRIKSGFENAHGEVEMMIEKDLTGLDKFQEEKNADFLSVTPNPSSGK
jgi:hypothetical protein